MNKITVYYLLDLWMEGELLPVEISTLLCTWYFDTFGKNSTQLRFRNLWIKLTNEIDLDCIPGEYLRIVEV